MLTIKIAKYPNNEIRVRLAPACSKRGSLSYESHNETEVRAGEQPDLTLAPNSKPPQAVERPAHTAGYGGKCKRTKFGTNAKRTLLRVGGAVDKLDPNPANGIFLTGTLPGSTHEAKQAIADWSAYIVHRLKAWIAKYVRSKIDFYVWERQKRGALHLHYFLHAPDPVARQYLLENFKSQWIRLLEAVSRKSGIDLFRKTKTFTHRNRYESIQAYAQEVTKSVAAYLAKYCGKSANAELPSKNSSYYPTRWWGASRPALQLLRSMSQSAELVFSNHSRAKRKYEDINSLLERHSIKGYRYGDKVGMGMNHVFYYQSEDLQSCYDQIRRTYGMSYQVATGSAESLIAELTRMIAFIKQSEKVWLGYWGNFTKESKQVVLKWEAGQSAELMQVYSLAVDLHLISINAVEYGYQPKSIYARVRSRAEFLSAALAALISSDAKPMAELRSQKSA